MHQMLLGGIHDDYAGHVRGSGEYILVVKHIAPPPEQVSSMLENLIHQYERKR